MIDDTIIRNLKSLLNQPLPGWNAQKVLIPEGRDSGFSLNDLHPAAVLIALYPQKDDWYFPLIQRSVDGFVHSGQIALPGGRREGSETDIETALREAQEEVNLPAQGIEILGRTSPLPIPVSRHLVQPVVGYMNHKPKLIPEPREVSQIFSISLTALTHFQSKIETRKILGHSWDIPFYEVQGYKIWGATAMILSEFRELILKVI